MNLKDFQIKKIEELFSFTKDNYEQSNKTKDRTHNTQNIREISISVDKSQI